MNKQLFIAFFYPRVGFKLGGAQLLYARIIEYLSIYTKQKIRLYDFNDGSIRNILQNLNVTNYEFIAIENDSTKLRNLGNEVFVISPVLLTYFPNILEEQNSVSFVVWDLLYSLWENLFVLTLKNSIRLSLSKLRKKYLCGIIKNHGFATLPEGKEYFENLADMQIKDDCILGIPIDGIGYKYKKTINKELRITYLGRSEFWKVAPVRKLLRDLKTFNISFKLNIITDNINDFKENLKESHFESFLNFKENLFGEKLTDYLISNSDIGFGMGTSCIEFAKLGIPTILADFSYKDFPDNYKYQWLYENNGRGLGQDIGINSWYGLKNLEELLNEFREDEANFIGKKCFDYVKKYNSIADISQKLIELSLNTTLNCKNLSCWLFKFNCLKRIIKNKFYKKERPLAL